MNISTSSPRNITMRRLNPSQYLTIQNTGPIRIFSSSTEDTSLRWHIEDHPESPLGKMKEFNRDRVNDKSGDNSPSEITYTSEGIQYRLPAVTPVYKRAWMSTKKRKLSQINLEPVEDEDRSLGKESSLMRLRCSTICPGRVYYHIFLRWGRFMKFGQISCKDKII
jgi:hypothetical protein